MQREGRQPDEHSVYRWHFARWSSRAWGRVNLWHRRSCRALSSVGKPGRGYSRDSRPSSGSRRRMRLDPWRKRCKAARSESLWKALRFQFVISVSMSEISGLRLHPKAYPRPLRNNTQRLHIWFYMFRYLVYIFIPSPPLASPKQNFRSAGAQSTSLPILHP